jgi:hypothetical protein
MKFRLIGTMWFAVAMSTAITPAAAAAAAATIAATCGTYQTAKPFYKLAELAISSHLQAAIVCRSYVGDEPIRASAAMSASLLKSIGLNPAQISVEVAKAEAKAGLLASRYKNPYAALNRDEATQACKKRLQKARQVAEERATNFLNRICAS